LSSNQPSPSPQHHWLTTISVSRLPATCFWRRGYCDLTRKFCPWLNTGSNASPHLFFIFSWWNEFSNHLYCNACSSAQLFPIPPLSGTKTSLSCSFYP
jgi:hypothetical protein